MQISHVNTEDFVVQRYEFSYDEKFVTERAMRQSATVHPNDAYNYIHSAVVVSEGCFTYGDSNHQYTFGKGDVLPNEFPTDLDRSTLHCQTDIGVIDSLRANDGQKCDTEIHLEKNGKKTEIDFTNSTREAWVWVLRGRVEINKNRYEQGALIKLKRTRKLNVYNRGGGVIWATVEK